MPDKCAKVQLVPLLPAFATKQLYTYCKDLGHGAKGDLDKINPDTQAMIANLLKSYADKSDLEYGKSFTPGIPIPIGELGLPGKLTVKIWPKDLSDLSKGPKEIQFRYEVLRW